MFLYLYIFMVLFLYILVDTFTVDDDINKISTLQPQFDWGSWIRFSKCDLSKFCTRLASEGETAKLIIVLNRHVYDLDRNPWERSEKVWNSFTYLYYCNT